MKIEEERKAFEKAIKEICKGVDIKNNINPDTGEYLYGVMQVMWVVWLASANRQGYKLVPVETLQESLNWAGVAKWDSPSKERDMEIEKHEKIIETMITAFNDH